MTDGWDESAEAWIQEMSGAGDYGRAFVIDPALRDRLRGRSFRRALDVGCGEGRLCRMLRSDGIDAVGLDPTAALLAAARERDPAGQYVDGRAEELPFDDGAFDLVVACALLEAGLLLRHFDEPPARGGDPVKAAYQRRAPWFVVMEWEKPAAR